MKLNIQVNRGLDGKFQKLSDMLEDYRDLYLEGMSAEIVNNSPSDTGTYITNHNLGTSEVPSTVTSSGQRRPPGTGPFDHPRHEQYAQQGFSKLLADIASLPTDTMRVVFSNATTYQDEVEFGYGYAPYGRAAREHSNIAQRAAQTAKSRNS